MYKLAIDVGGTHTDGVLLKQGSSIDDIQILVEVKFLTLFNITDSVMSVIDLVLAKAKDDGHNIQRNLINIHLGTTHFVNALKQRQGLERVAVIRLALPTSDLVPPFFSWPQGEGSLLNAVYGFSAIVHGGSEANGQIISKLSIAELDEVAQQIIACNIQHVVISSPNATTHPEMELAAQLILEERLPENVTISLSQSFLQDRLLQRENAAILNAALLAMAQTTFKDILPELNKQGFTAPLLVTRNDGSFMSVEEAMHKPLLAYSSGLINSVRGVSMLVPDENALVVDVGGTTTDVGLLKNKVPYMTNLNKEEDGVEFMVDCVHQNSIPLGGGTKIVRTTEGKITLVQPRKDEMELPFYMGGESFTLTDLGLIHNRITIEDINHNDIKQRALKQGFFDEDIETADQIMHQRAADVIDKTRVSNEPLAIVLCGGGAQLIDHIKLSAILRFPCQAENIKIPKHAVVANAIGAAGATIRVRESIDYLDTGEQEKAEAIQKAKQRAIICGAQADTLKIVSEFVQEYSYSQDGLKKFTVVIEGQASCIIDEERLIISKDFNLVPARVNLDVLIQQKPYSKKYLRSNPITSIIGANEIEEENIHVLSEQDIEHLRIGAGYLGSGGGGDVNIASLVAQSMLRSGHQLKIIRDMTKLNDDDYVVAVGYGGMPEVFNEKLSSGLTGQIAIKNMQKQLEQRLGHPINIAAAVAVEIGGANGLLAASLVASLGLPILDADLMGLAFPSMLMVTPHIFGDFKDHLIVLAKEDEEEQCVVLNERSLEEGEKLVYEKIKENGGSMFVAMMPMTVAKIRSLCIPNTFSAAIEIGRQVSASLKELRPIAEALGDALRGTIYRHCNTLISGMIMSLNRYSDGKHNFGEVIVEDKNGERCKILYQNENLVAIKNNEVISLTPELITLINPDTGLAFTSSVDYHVGLRVEVITIGCPQYYLDKNNKLLPQADTILRDYKIKSLVQKATGLSDEKVFNRTQGDKHTFFSIKAPDVVNTENLDHAFQV